VLTLLGRATAVLGRERLPVLRQAADLPRWPVTYIGKAATFALNVGFPADPASANGMRSGGRVVLSPCGWAFPGLGLGPCICGRGCCNLVQVTMVVAANAQGFEAMKRSREEADGTDERLRAKSRRHR